MSSGPRPRDSTSGMYADFQPFSCRWMESSKSSVSELVGKPPTLSNAVRRNSTLVPQQNTAPSPSLPRADGAEEQRLLGPGGRRDPVALVRVVLRRLHERDLRVLHVAERGLEERRVGHVVGVEHRDERRVGLREGVVDVARLGAGVLVPADVADAVAGGEVAHRVVVAVVEHPTRTSAPRRPAAAATVRSTISSGSL